MPLKRKAPNHPSAACGAQLDEASDTNESAASRRPANSKSASSSKSNSSSTSTGPSKNDCRNKAGQHKHAVNTGAIDQQAARNATSSSDRYQDEQDLLSEDDECSGGAGNGRCNVAGSGLDALEDRDGAIAELRRRAPEVTVTLVKQDELQVS